jgi:hypothetical protein
VRKFALSLSYRRGWYLQICYLRQFHAILRDEEIQDRSSFKGILKFGSRMVTHLFARLDPKPVSLEKQKGQQEQSEKETGEHMCICVTVATKSPFVTASQSQRN